MLRFAGHVPRWAAIAGTRPAPRTSPRPYYGYDRLPAADEPVRGGFVKFQRLAEVLPNAPRDFNVLYIGSSVVPPDAATLFRLARRRRAPIVWNQDGVAYPGWHGPGWAETNRPLARGVHEADHVFFQSEFCKLSSDRFLGTRDASWEILYNAVDTEAFTPRRDGRRDRLTLLLGGSQYQRYRVDAALDTLAALRPARPDARLVIAGELRFVPDRAEASRLVRSRIAELGLEDAVELVGSYTQRDAPALMRRADLLLHTKYNDPCPGVVIEAMACGLPVVHSASGGVPELVGDAGAGVAAPLDWEQDHPPAGAELARAVVAVAERLDELSAAARTRAVERFGLRAWLERHRRVFEELLS